MWLYRTYKHDYIGHGRCQVGEGAVSNGSSIEECDWGPWQCCQKEGQSKKEKLAGIFDKT